MTTASGVLELSESVAEGVRCEVAEETGALVEVDALTGVYKNVNRGVFALVFRCTPKSLPATTADEACEVRWMTIAEGNAYMSPVFAIRVLDAFKPQARVRIHDGVTVLTG